MLNNISQKVVIEESLKKKIKIGLNNLIYLIKKKLKMKLSILMMRWTNMLKSFITKKDKEKDDGFER